MIGFAAVGALVGFGWAGGSTDAEPSGPGGARRSTEAGSNALPSTRLAGDVPVLVVPGWLDTARDLAAMRIRFLGAGWASEAVQTLTFEEPTGSNRDHAVELAVAIDTLRARTGADRIDIVAHSMGGLATRWYLRGFPGAPVRKVVFIASPHRGTLSAHLAWGGGREEMMPGSPFLDTLNAAQPGPVGVDAITIRTLIDTHIVPGESATLPDVPDFEVCCPTHAGLMRDDEVFQIVLDFLEGG
ncbi:MAG: alpha/beta fold hydrolase [Gemmatimonadota bacterium]|nr:alpha/beta fold hydrolase [Gemmatimonadota bacterium]